jgi:Na+-transporting NADH:ubiquinone oxidoreductase subunit C
MRERETLGRTLLVAASVALVCSLIVSVAVTWLRPIQLAYESVERNRVVLVAAGLVPATAVLDDREIVARSLELEPALVDLDAGSLVSADPGAVAAYDYRTAADDPSASRSIDASADIAALGRRPLLMPVYFRYVDGTLDRLILSIYGSGMWSTIHAFIALDSNLTHIVGLHVAEHGETPGLGDRIEDPSWLAQWSGKRAFDGTGAPALTIGAAPAGSDDTRIDGITGATVTVEALGAIVRYWLGDDGYGPFLTAQRAAR